MSTTGHQIDPYGVDHAGHYNRDVSGIECIDVMRYLPSNLGNAFKYVFRAGLKGSAHKDLSKALWYLRDHQQHEAEIGPIALPTVVFNRLTQVILSCTDADRQRFYQGLYHYLVGHLSLGGNQMALALLQLIARHDTVGPRAGSDGPATD